MCTKTFSLPTKNTAFTTHSDLKVINDHEHRNDILNAIATEYGEFDKRGLWKLTHLHDGAKCHHMMLLIKQKLLSSGEEEKIKARAVTMGIPIGQGLTTMPTVLHLVLSLSLQCTILDAVQHEKYVKSCAVKQAFNFGEAGRRTFVRCSWSTSGIR